MGLKRDRQKLLDWQRRSKALKPGKAPARGKRIRPVNPVRKAKLLAEQFGEQAELCRHLPCCACFPELYTPELRALDHWSRTRISDPHHSPTVGAGGSRDTSPACRRCHRRLDSLNCSEAALEQERGMSFRATAALLAAHIERQRIRALVINPNPN